MRISGCPEPQDSLRYIPQIPPTQGLRYIPRIPPVMMYSHWQDVKTQSYTIDLPHFYGNIPPSYRCFSALGPTKTMREVLWSPSSSCQETPKSPSWYMSLTSVGYVNIPLRYPYIINPPYLQSAQRLPYAIQSGAARSSARIVQQKLTHCWV
jgi:hypothetical protein